MPEQQIHTQTFPNGLTLIIEPMADVQSAAFSLMVPAGSNYDPPGREGAASVLVDWITRGAGDRDSMQLTNELDNLGLQRNEGVGNSHLSFTGATVAESLPAALAIYADIVQSPHLPDDEFEPARIGVEQSLKAIEDEPRQKVMIELRRRCYDAPWGTPCEGTLEGVRRLEPGDSRELFERCAGPRDAILGIAGKVDVPATIDLVGRLLGNWKSKPAATYQSGPRGATRDHIHHDSTQTQIGIAYDSVPYHDQGYYAAWAAVSVLSGGMSSRLFTEVREKRGLCYSVYASLNSLREEGRVLCYAGTTTERAQETLDVTLRELIRLGEGIAPDELKRCQALAKSSLIMQQESSSSRASSIARDWYHLGRVTTLNEVRQKIDALTVPMLLEHIRAHPAKDFTILTLGAQPLEVNLGVS
ncbi:MAG: insulinase family protein [Planctomycetaceae bacterium]|nr:insulinase family protein [Planctomycetaceae bacterium]